MDKVIVDQSQSSVYGFIEPQTIQPSGNSPDHIKLYMQTWMVESNRDIYFAPYIDAQCVVVWFCSCHKKIPPAFKNMLQEIVGKPRGQQLKVLYPKIRTIIRATIKDKWIERFKNPSPLPDDIIHALKQKWATYLLERWS
ncbi:hypothetical protein DEO72_LG1g2682 [Vigna unguiculata]|uniref:Uncharacterized protein n=1 Tax=Vigna unguiculata TaxID=3917 RepID=A0A4D6KR33_VIGUN|nr:hypothetical protein DEO72_LG1g2682 [Vigna unguiculata]